MIDEVFGASGSRVVIVSTEEDLQEDLAKGSKIKLPYVCMRCAHLGNPPTTSTSLDHLLRGSCECACTNKSNRAEDAFDGHIRPYFPDVQRQQPAFPSPAGKGRTLPCDFLLNTSQVGEYDGDMRNFGTTEFPRGIGHFADCPQPGRDCYKEKLCLRNKLSS